MEAGQARTVGVAEAVDEVDEAIAFKTGADVEELERDVEDEGVVEAPEEVDLAVVEVEEEVVEVPEELDFAVDGAVNKL